jgi:RNA polymerase sigma factor (sigma-70 family)
MDSAETNPRKAPPATAPEAIGGRDLRSAIGDLVESTEDEVFRFIFRRIGNRETALELTQETFVRVWHARNQFDPSRNSRAWVLTIASRLVVSHLRSTGALKRGHPMSLDHLVGRAETGGNGKLPAEPADRNRPDPVDSLIIDEEIKAMDRAADDLNEKDRELYRLRRKGLSNKEISEQTGRSEASVGPALTRLLAKMRGKLSPHNS